MTALKTFSDLLSAGLAAAEDEAALRPTLDRYALAIPAYLAQKLAAESADGPLRRQYLPAPAEADAAPQENPDPIGDRTHAPVKGIVHRYPDRVLLKPLHACAVYCRFCFRREMVGPGGEALDDAELAAALAYVASRPEVWEVVVTGGDPFMLSPRRLRAIMDGLSAIPHVESVRFHTRVPVADPERVSDELVAALTETRPAVWAAVHVNHADEFTAESTGALDRLVKAGVPLVGQTVLLKGVNDDADTLAALFRAMVRRRIKPYYLHHPDLAPGTAHFRPSPAEGDRLVKALRGKLSGLAQPTYVLDIPGGHGKVPAASAWVRTGEDGSCLVTDPQGVTHVYKD